MLPSLRNAKEVVCLSFISEGEDEVMGIANELSSDVAAAILGRSEHQVQEEKDDLVAIVRNFHTAMRHLAGEERRRRVVASLSAKSTGVNSQAASG